VKQKLRPQCAFSGIAYKGDRMSRGNYAVKDTTIARVIRGVERAGHRPKAVLVSPKSGEIKVEIGVPDDPATPAAPAANEWDDAE
jgi:hypothetical protein